MTQETRNEHQAAAEAEVNAPAIALTPLFDVTGRVIYTPDEDVELRLSQGWTRAKLDLGTIKAEIPQLATEVGRLAVQYIEEVERDGYIDTTDQATYAALQQATSSLMGRIGRSVDVLNMRYQPRAYEGARMVRDGEEIRVDPGQIAEFEAQGFKAAEAAEGEVSVARSLYRVTRTNPETNDAEESRIAPGDRAAYEAAGWSVSDTITERATVPRESLESLRAAGWAA